MNPRTCTVGTNALIGSHSQIFDNAVVTSSVIGRRCKIHPRAKITNSYIFDDTIIEADCVITNSIIGSMVHVKEGTVVEKGCLIADEVIIGPRGVLKQFERVSKRIGKPSAASGTDDEDEDSELEDIDEGQCFAVQRLGLRSFFGSEQLEKLRANLGSGSNAFVWPPRTPNPEDEGTGEIENFNNQRLMRLGDDAPDLYVSEAESISTSGASSPSESDMEDNVDESLSSASSSASISTPAASNKGISKEELEFKVEVIQSLERAFEEGHSVDNAAVELKTLRMASNVPLTRVREAVIAALVDRIRVVSPEEGPTKQKAEVENVMERWGELINKIGGVNGVETISFLQVLLLTDGSSNDTDKILRRTTVQPRIPNCLAKFWSLSTKVISSTKMISRIGNDFPLQEPDRVILRRTIESSGRLAPGSSNNLWNRKARRRVTRRMKAMNRYSEDRSSNPYPNDGVVAELGRFCCRGSLIPGTFGLNEYSPRSMLFHLYILHESNVEKRNLLVLHNLLSV